MPKETFFNLPEQKRARVIEAALDEFAAYPYHKARITAIADQAGIAKGSFYQYFADKKDLFKYIADLIVNKKLEYLNHDMMLNKDKYGFFELLHELYLSGFRFAKENPRLIDIANNLLNNKELQRELWNDYEDQSFDYFQLLLKEGLAKGELDPTIDTALVSRLLTGINYSLGDILYKGKDGKIDLDDESGLIETIDKMLAFIKNGIKKRE
ncbi:MAG: TetR/AcrR family transcriptional regulator [Halanaerobiales bacterium]|nr:TetR/AcrR family transcriptional regulator [Halanaerobiales bacterium]